MPRNLVSVGHVGKIVRLAHDGRIKVRGGYANIYTGAGHAQERLYAPCIDCGSSYYW